MFRSFGFALALLPLVACQTASAKVDCTKVDNVKLVAAETGCLQIETFGKAAPDSTTNMVIFIHGDHSRGGPAESLLPLATETGRDGVISVRLIRPGHRDQAGNQSSGYAYRDGDSYPAGVVDAVAAGIRNLRNHYKPRSTLLVGHSGGAAITGVIIGKYPDLAQAAVLASCPCNIAEWRIARRGSNNWTSSQSPHEHVGGVAKNTRVIAITGERDSNTRPNLAEDYAASLKSKGVAATYIGVAGAGHNSILRSSDLKKVIEEAVAALP